MKDKEYQTKEKVADIAAEPKVAYVTKKPIHIDPNVPFHGTHEECLDHIHEIEQGNFTPLEEANKEFEEWKKEFLASRLN